MPKFYYYIEAAELAGKTCTEQPAVTIANHSLYFDEDALGGGGNGFNGW